MNDRDDILAELRTWEELPPVPEAGFPEPAGDALELPTAEARPTRQHEAETPEPDREDALPPPQLPEPSWEELPVPLPAPAGEEGLPPTVEATPPGQDELPPLTTAEEGANIRQPLAAAPRAPAVALPEWEWAEPIEDALPEVLPAPLSPGEEPGFATAPTRMAPTLPGGVQNDRRDAELPEWEREAVDGPSPFLSGLGSAPDRSGELPDLTGAEEAADLLPGLTAPAGRRGEPDAEPGELLSAAEGDGAGLGGEGRVVQLLERMVGLLESLVGGGGSSIGSATRRRPAGPGRQARERDNESIDILDPEADEGFPTASPSVNVSTVPGTGGAGGVSLGSRIPTPQSLLSGGRGRPRSGPGRSSFLEPGGH